MAGIKPYYTSNSLIEAVKRNIAVPLTQLTFLPEDILAFANTEVFSAQMPSIMQYHEEYYVYEQDVPLVANKSRYPIPNRAIGMKLRDLVYKDTQGNLIEMSMINPDNKSSFGKSLNSGNPGVHYYIQNNSIILTPDIGPSPTGSLLFTYFLRPNSLVPDEEAVICSSFSNTITVDNATLVVGDTLTIGELILTAGTEFAIGVNSSITASNIVTYINSLAGLYSVVANSAIITLTYIDRSTVIVTSNVLAFTVSINLTINSTQNVPVGITSGVLVDFLQTDGGHSTHAFDVFVGNNSVSATSITFPNTTIPVDFVAGDYICLQYECIIPQVPTDLHNILAERVCSRILKAQGDQEGLKNARMDIQDLEARQAAMIDNRVDGSPQKVVNRHGLLGVSRRYRR